MKKQSGIGIASLIVGIISLLLSCVGIGIVGIVGIILSIIALTKKENAKGMAIAGLATSVLGFIISLIIIGAISSMPTEEKDGEKTLTGEYVGETEEDLTDTEVKETEKDGEEEKQSEDKEDEKEEERKGVTGIEAQKTEEEAKEEQFLKDLKSVLDEQVAEKAYDILKNQIGFSELEYEGRLDETTNWEIGADGAYIILTASDDVYRIFMPNTSYVFYEDGEVKLTAAEYLKTVISWEDESQYYIIAKTIIGDCVTGKSKFPSNPTGMEKNGGLVVVQGTVQGQNSFGATVEEAWTVEFLVYDLDSWSYEPVYIKLGDSTVGEFIKLEDWEE